MIDLRVLYFLSIYFFPLAIATEVTVETYTIDRSLDIEIHLPVLTCHVRHTNYTEVSWYKDYVLLKKGSSKLSDHFLPLSSLLQTDSTATEFEHPLKLQGYYWCETDHTKASTIFDYLFRINEVHTFVGRFISSRDSLGDSNEVTLKEKKTVKKQIYEAEMQNILFAFLPAPSVSVRDIKQLRVGLQVRFFLYVRQVLHPRKPVDDKLVMDQHHLEYIQEFLNNQTSTVDPQLYYEVLDWTKFRGINVEEIQLKSTLGCYEEMEQSNSSIEQSVWNNARIGDIVISDNACSAKNGLAVTRICTGSFFRGATWSQPSGSCEKPPRGVTEQLKKLYDAFGTEDRKPYIDKLTTLTKYPSDVDATGLHIVTEILKALSTQTELDHQEIDAIFTVVDRMVDTNRTELDVAKNILHLTSRILKVLENILEKASEEDKEIKISKQHILVDTKYTKANSEKGLVLGFAVTSPNMDTSLKNGSIEFVYNNSKQPIPNAMAYFALPEDLVESRESLKILGQVNMIFFKDWFLFQTPKDVLVKRNFKIVPTPVMYVSLSGGPAWNLTNPVELYFKDTVEEHVEDPVCVYYDPRLDNGIGAWNSEGCEYGGLKNGFYNCRCHHLSIFAIILSQNPDTSHKLKLGTSVYVGCGVSLLALSFAVVLFVLSKHWRKTVDQQILFCLSLTYLICLILIFISEMHLLWSSGCMVLALIFQYTVFSVFGWLLVQAIVYKLRFTKKTDVCEISHFMIKACLSVWSSPIVIVIIIWLSREYTCPTNHNCWLTVSEVSLVSVIPMVVLMLVTLCINVCATYAVTCRFRKDFLIGESNYNEVVVKFRVAFTIFIFFVLTWLFGFFALQKRTKELQILFSISFTLTAYYVMLFFVFQEISFWDLFNKREKKEPEVPVIKYEAKSYNTIEEPQDKIQ